MKRLIQKENNHDFTSRDEAVAIIDGKIYTDLTHAKCINKYLQENNEDLFSDNWTRPNENHIDEAVDKIAFAHKLDYSREIFLEEESLRNMTLNEACEILKSNYPDYSIYNDSIGIEEIEYPMLVANKKEKRLIRNN